ncbi:hypothetical protein BOTCAL_0013g00310 [Botryotinia calthae]|uniref:Uncharacterized protein n=1 Tax=Botryotinia calthae TaxID=38488 RepID=A0A4Y8DIJ6_9HELO|nr:hypothetical protein BOTCAL_0013g00310 [Botryotinia calthae]
MHTKNILAFFALTTSVLSAPIPSPKFSSLGSAFGNLNWDSAGNSVGNGNKGNGNDNGDGSGSNNGKGNVFENGNAIGSGNSGISILKRGSGSNVVGSALSNLNGNGNDNSLLVLIIEHNFLPSQSTQTDSNSAGNKNWGNGNGNGDNSESSNGNDNIFGNKNSIRSGNSGFSILNKVRRQSDAADIIPDQTVTGLTKVVTEAFNSFLPTALPDIIKGALTGTESGFGKGQVEKRQLVLTGLGDVIAQDVAAFIP